MLRKEQLNAEAERLFAAGEIVGAKAKLRLLIQRDPANVRALNNLGVIMWQTGGHKEALQLLTQALKVDANDRRTVVNLGNVLTAFGQREDAYALYEAYLKTKPDDAAVAALMDTVKPAVSEEFTTVRAPRAITDSTSFPKPPKRGEPGSVRRLIVYQGPWNWNFLWNRAQPLARALSEYATVIYVDTDTRLTSHAKAVERTGTFGPHGLLKTVTDSLYRYEWYAPTTHGHLSGLVSSWDRSQEQYAKFKSDIDPIVQDHDEIWLISNSPRPLGIHGLYPWDRIIVDIEDPWLSLSWGRHMAPHIVKSILRSADCVFANGAVIADEYQDLSGRPIYSLPCGIDSRALEAFKKDLPRPSFFPKNRTKPCVVFTGNCDRRVDMEQLQKIVKACPFAEFRFVGPADVLPNQEATWERIKKYRHFRHIRRIPQAELPAVQKHADILLLLNSNFGGTKMFPSKLYEYIAAGRIVLSTLDFSYSMMPNKAVIHCKTAEDFIGHIADFAAGRLTLSEEDAEETRQVAAKNSYEARAVELLAMVEPLTETAPPAVRKRARRAEWDAVERLNYRAEQLALHGDAASAKAILVDLVDKAPFNTRILNNLAVLEYRAGNVKAALELFNRGMILNTNDRDLFLDCAHVVEELGEAKTAHSVLAQATGIARRAALDRRGDAEAAEAMGRIAETETAAGELSSRSHLSGIEAKKYWAKKATEIAGVLLEDELWFLYDMALNSPHGDVLDLGTTFGRSTCLLSGACRTRGDESKVLCVSDFRTWPDEWSRQSSRISLSHDTLSAFTRNAMRLGFADAVITVRANVAEALPRLGSKLRMAFLDGREDYDSVLEELQLIEGSIVPGGFVVLYNALAAPLAVETAARDFFDDNPNYARFGQIRDCLAYKRVA